MLIGEYRFPFAFVYACSHNSFVEIKKRIHLSASTLLGHFIAQIISVYVSNWKIVNLLSFRKQIDEFSVD